MASQPQLYFDHNATAPLRSEAIAAMQAAMGPPSNPSSVHTFGRHARMTVEAARAEVAMLAGCRAADVVFTSGGTEFNLGPAEDVGNNFEEDPRFADWDTSASDPSGYDLSLQATSPARDSGPVNGEGPPGYTDWADPDTTRNDRGYTGGPGAQP